MNLDPTALVHVGLTKSPQQPGVVSGYYAQPDPYSWADYDGLLDTDEEEQQ